MKLNPRDRYAFLSKMHRVYAANETVEMEDGTILKFEPEAYHLGMARFYAKKALTTVFIE